MLAEDSNNRITLSADSSGVSFYNGCNNVVAVEKGVAAREGLESIKFGGREYSFTTDRLASIVQESKISEIDFLKMDIEGYETQVLQDSIDVVEHCRVIAIEMHGTKKAIDDILLPLGFVFALLQKNHIYRRILTLNRIFDRLIMNLGPVPSQFCITGLHNYSVRPIIARKESG